MTSCDIKADKGHYVMIIDGNFYGCYDTFNEAVRDFEKAYEERDDASGSHEAIMQ